MCSQKTVQASLCALAGLRLVEIGILLSNTRSCCDWGLIEKKSEIAIKWKMELNKKKKGEEKEKKKEKRKEKGKRRWNISIFFKDQEKEIFFF